VLGFGILTVLIASIIIGYQRDYKRMLAYSSMENMGVILVGFSLGGIGALGAIIQIVAHAFAKSSAFYEAGNILVEYETTRMADAQGVIGRLRSTGYLFILSCLSITGAPPFGVFLGEFLILSQAIQSGNLAIRSSSVLCYTIRKTIWWIFSNLYCYIHGLPSNRSYCNFKIWNQMEC
jgi:hydrogenase-4 component F